MKHRAFYERSEYSNYVTLKSHKKVTKVIAETLNCEMLRAENVELVKLKDYDLIGFGSGIFTGKLKFHKNIIQLIDSLPKQLRKKAFVYSTSGQGNVRLQGG